MKKKEEYLYFQLHWEYCSFI